MERLLSLAPLDPVLAVLACFTEPGEAVRGRPPGPGMGGAQLEGETTWLSFEVGGKVGQLHSHLGGCNEPSLATKRILARCRIIYDSVGSIQVLCRSGLTYSAWV